MLNPLPKVSIIIPCWNAEKYIADAIGSCLGQSYVDVEVIVVNDGSTDRSQEIIDRFNGQVVSLTITNGGANRARNVGLSSASGRFIKFLDADDYLWPGAIAAQVAHTDTLLPNEFSVGQSYKYDQDRAVLSKYPRWKVDELGNVSLAQMIRVPPNTSNPLYRRDRLDRISGFDVEVKVRQEVDLFLRYVFDGSDPVSLNYPIYVWRNHSSPGRVSRTPLDLGVKSDLRMYNRAVNTVVFDLGLSKRLELRAALGLGIWNMGRHLLRNGHVCEAKELFSLAVKCNPATHVEGRLPYKLAVKMLGARKTELIFEYIKRVLTRRDIGQI
jgi:glycosyltransferase involved in cell wall biosynthesis